MPTKLLRSALTAVLDSIETTGFSCGVQDGRLVSYSRPERMDVRLTLNKQDSMPPPDDDREIRCPRLGGQVTFGYCRQEALGKPCFKALDCWHVYFDAETFFRTELGDAVFEQIFHVVPRPRLVTLVDLIAKARNSLEKGSDSRNTNVVGNSDS